MRVVSLVPSLTEGLATAGPLVGITDWCPPVEGAARVRGTKNPDLAAIRALEPDLVIANKEENRELDVRRLREAGLRVEVTEISTVPEAVETYERLLAILDWKAPDWLNQARSVWCGPIPEPTRTVAVPIWRDPWMVVGSQTFTDDVLARLGWHNVVTQPRYPHTTVAEIEALAPDVVLLPDEPYVFSEPDRSAFALPTELISGRLITWYGPSLVEAYALK